MLKGLTKFISNLLLFAFLLLCLLVLGNFYFAQWMIENYGTVGGVIYFVMFFIIVGGAVKTKSSGFLGLVILCVGLSGLYLAGEEKKQESAQTASRKEKKKQTAQTIVHKENAENAPTEKTTLTDTSADEYAAENVALAFRDSQNRRTVNNLAWLQQECGVARTNVVVDPEHRTKVQGNFAQVWVKTICPNGRTILKEIYELRKEGGKWQISFQQTL